MLKADKEKITKELIGLSSLIMKALREHHSIQLWMPSGVQDNEMHINGLMSMFIGTVLEFDSKMKSNYLAYIKKIMEMHSEIKICRQWVEQIEEIQSEV